MNAWRTIAALISIVLMLTSACVDTNKSCSTWVRNGFCTSNYYTLTQKQQYCAASCNLCGPLTSDCVDMSNQWGLLQCRVWVSNGFCRSSAYTDAQKAQYCCASCHITSTKSTTASTTHYSSSSHSPSTSGSTHSGSTMTTTRASG